MPVPSSCPVCEHPNAVTRTEGSSREYVCECPRCLTYATAHEFLLFGQDERFAAQKHLLCGLLREINETNDEIPLVEYQSLEAMLADGRIPADTDIDAKQQKILQGIRRKSVSFGSPVTLSIEDDRSIGYTRDEREFRALLKELTRAELIEMEMTPDVEVDEDAHLVANGVQVTLSGEAWKKTEPGGDILFS